MSAAEHRRYMAHNKKLKAALKRAQSQRDKHRDPVRVTDVDGREASEVGWVVHEWNVMHAEVNRLRAKAGLPAIDVNEIRLVEHSAMGHSDYTHKYALRCADLVRRTIDAHP